MHTWTTDYGAFPGCASEPYDLTPESKKLRRFIIQYFMDNQHGPNIHTIQQELGFSQETLWHSIDQLHIGVQVMVTPGTELSLMKMPPFSYVPTRHEGTLDDGRKYNLGCGGEAAAAHKLFPGKEMTVKSLCPCCWEPITHKWKDGQLLSVDAPNAVIHIGRKPTDWSKNFVYTCENINYFKDLEHVAIWEKQFPEKKGATMPIAKVYEWVKPQAEARYWDYDQPPDVVSSKSLVSTSLQGLKKAGFDVSAWEGLY
ncbi:unnamed protein product [Clonostachys rhizophaga]|uniref:Uncharacterized protein n=1 Tax=Clonostachys rhizophaga TaxID=160324 RepID=A0A9N9VX64_9HYPO|nr:unnamed protein product [Clonostachys rhizophaga]